VIHYAVGLYESDSGIDCRPRGIYNVGIE